MIPISVWIYPFFLGSRCCVSGTVDGESEAVTSELSPKKKKPERRRRRRRKKAKWRWRSDFDRRSWIQAEIELNLFKPPRVFTRQLVLVDCVSSTRGLGGVASAQITLCGLALLVRRANACGLAGCVADMSLDYSAKLLQFNYCHSSFDLCMCCRLTLNNIAIVG